METRTFPPFPNRQLKQYQKEDKVADCIGDAYSNHGWMSVWLTVQSACLPETTIAIAAACVVKKFYKMRVKYILSIALGAGIAYVALVPWLHYGIILWLVLWGFVLKPLIDIYFIRKRNLTHGHPLPWHYPLTQQYTWDLMFHKGSAED